MLYHIILYYIILYYMPCGAGLVPAARPAACMCSTQVALRISPQAILPEPSATTADTCRVPHHRVQGAGSP